jgi:hypothetical protein
MYDFQGTQLSTMSVDQLIERAAREASIAGDSGSADVHHGRAKVCIEIANLRLAQEDQSLRRRQVDLTDLANKLSERILQGNEESARADCQSSLTMNKATEQLAKSTSQLNKATWILAAFTAIQTITALLSSFLSFSHK